MHTVLQTRRSLNFNRPDLKIKIKGPDFFYIARVNSMMFHDTDVPECKQKDFGLKT